MFLLILFKLVTSKNGRISKFINPANPNRSFEECQTIIHCSVTPGEQNYKYCLPQCVLNHFSEIQSTLFKVEGQKYLLGTK